MESLVGITPGSFNSPKTKPGAACALGAVNRAQKSPKAFNKFDIPPWIVTDFALHKPTNGPWGVPTHTMVTRTGKFQSVELIKNPSYRLPLLAIRDYQAKEKPTAADRTALHAVIGTVDPDDVDAVAYFEHKLARIENDRAAMKKPAVRDTSVGSVVLACGLFYVTDLEGQISMINKIRDIVGLDRLSLSASSRNLKNKDRSELFQFLRDNCRTIQADADLAKFLNQAANLTFGFDLNKPVDFLTITADRIAVSGNVTHFENGHSRRIPKAAKSS